MYLTKSFFMHIASAEEAKAIAKKKVGGGKPKKKKKEEKKESITEDEVEVWATASLFCCQLCDPPLAMQGKEKFSRHLVDEHSTPYRQYAKQCQDYKLVSSCHTCKVPIPTFEMRCLLT